MSEDYDIIFDPGKGFLGSQSDKNIEKLIASIINYAKHKKAIYDQNSPEKDLKIIQESLKSSLSLLDEQSKNKDDYLMSDEKTASKIKDKVVENNGDKYISTIENIAKFRAKVAANDALLQKYCVEYPKDPAKIGNELKTNIKNAIENLRVEVSGNAPQTVKYRRMIEEMVIKFATSWESFKNSYALNYCLRGGAGVGKTTFAKAVAKCIAAYGILATDYIKLADKTDFIAEYLGQTVYKTSNTLYSSIEGVCFIDEAYAVGATKDYGDEFIGELTLFTQKFPGCICIIVAGYEKEMKKYFFDKNEGLYRRFPNNLELRPYDINTINAAIVSKIASKLKITDIESIRKATSGHQVLVKYLYMDTSIDIKEYERFNLYPIMLAILQSNSVEKRNILKTYILKKYMGIPEGDLFPNQMGDVQNIVDKITMTKSILDTGNVTLKTAFENINAFLEIRGVAKVYYDTKNDKTDLTTNGVSPKTFETTVINPLGIKMFGTVENLRALRANPEDPKVAELFNTSINQLYTEAVVYLYSYTKAVDAGTEKVKISTHVDVNFLNQEYSSLETMAKTNPASVLSYKSALEAVSEKEMFDVLEKRQVGSIRIPTPKTLQDSCEGAVPVVTTNDPANNDGAVIDPDVEMDLGDLMEIIARKPPSPPTKIVPYTGSIAPPSSGFEKTPPTSRPSLFGVQVTGNTSQPPMPYIPGTSRDPRFRGSNRRKKHGTYRAKPSTLHKTYRSR